MNETRRDAGSEIAAPASTAWSIPLVTHEAIVGLTIALIAIPQCVGFASIAGLPPAAGIASAVAMGVISTLVSNSPRLVIGPVITNSTMLLAVLRTVEPDSPENWPAVAAALSVLVGVMTLAGMAVGIGRLVRFVSRSVIVGLVVGSVLLTIGSQLAPSLGVRSGPAPPTLIGMLWQVVSHLEDAQLLSAAMAASVFVFVVAGAKLGPRFPTAFVVLLLSGVAAWLFERAGIDAGFQTIGPMSWRWAGVAELPPGGENLTNLVAGAAAIGLVGIIQNLAIGKALALRGGEEFDSRRELLSLGLANVAAGAAQGFPGSASFARSALAELVGARTRLSSLIAAAATGGIALLAAPLVRYVTAPAVAGLLIATAISMIDRGELRALLRDVHDRPVLVTMIACVFVLPIHWALLIGLAVSFVILLRRVSRVHLFEMVRTPEGPFREQEIDERTGTSAITMIQVEGSLFFAHAELLANRLRDIFRRGPRVTILRMRRTQQIDFSILVGLCPPVRQYLAGGGHLIICGLTPEMRAALINSPLGEIVDSDFMLETTREVFGSAHVAIGLAQCILTISPAPQREVFRTQESVAKGAIAAPATAGNTMQD